MKKLLPVLLIAATLWPFIEGTGQIPFTLLWGWIPFLYRSTERVRLNWDGLGQFVIACSLAVLLIQFLGRWFTREISLRQNAIQTRWRWKWSVMIVLALGTVFTSGIAFIGITHQTVWLARSPTSLLGRGLPFLYSSRHQLKHMALAQIGYSETLNWPGNSAKEVRPDPTVNWITESFPYLGYIAPRMQQSRGWGNREHDAIFQSAIYELLNPELTNAPVRDHRGYGLTHYVGNSHYFPGGTNAFPPGQARPKLMIGEISSDFVPWGSPAVVRDPMVNWGKPEGFSGPPGRAGIYFAQSDGSVKLIDQSIDPEVLRQLAIPGP